METEELLTILAKSSQARTPTHFRPKVDAYAYIAEVLDPLLGIKAYERLQLSQAEIGAWRHLLELTVSQEGAMAVAAVATGTHGSPR